MNRKQKQYIVAMSTFQKLPDTIKDAAASIETMEIIDRLLKEAGIEGEEHRLALGDIVYSIFIGELPPPLLTDAIKEELAIDETKSQLVSALVKKSFVEPNIDFLTKLYQPQKQSPTPSVPKGNVVNLRRD